MTDKLGCGVVVLPKSDKTSYRKHPRAIYGSDFVVKTRSRTATKNHTDTSTWQKPGQINLAPTCICRRSIEVSGPRSSGLSGS